MWRVGSLAYVSKLAGMEHTRSVGAARGGAEWCWECRTEATRSLEPLPKVVAVGVSKSAVSEWFVYSTDR